MQIALSAKNRSQIQNTGATEGPTLDMKMMFLWGKILRASARICVNDQSNSKLYSHYNMVPEIFSQALWRACFIDARMSCISSFWPSMYQYRSSKDKNSWDDMTIRASSTYTFEKLRGCPVSIANIDRIERASRMFYNHPKPVQSKPMCISIK
jgi:hypothetical protein